MTTISQIDHTANQLTDNKRVILYNQSSFVKDRICLHNVCVDLRYAPNLCIQEITQKELKLLASKMCQYFKEFVIQEKGTL